MIREAVILAAGKGTRRSADDLPKPLQLVGDVPLIKRALLTLAEAGVTRAIVVTGFMADQVRAALEGDPSYAAAGLSIEFVHNAQFEQGDGISVLVGGALCAGPFLLSMVDQTSDSAVVKALGTKDMAAADVYLATDAKIRDVPEDATKVLSYGGRIVDIGQAIVEYDRLGCGLFAVTPKLLETLAEVRAERGDCALSEGVRRLADNGRARVADINATRPDITAARVRDRNVVPSG